MRKFSFTSPKRKILTITKVGRTRTRKQESNKDKKEGSPKRRPEDSE